MPATTATAARGAATTAKPRRVRAPKTPAATPTLAHVHETNDSAALIEMTPPHPPRTETPEYAKAHRFLINTKNAPCRVCKVTKRTLKNPAKNPAGATQMETHHAYIERSLASACDPAKVHEDFPAVYDRDSLMRWVDSPENLLVLCDIHHRHPERGIHHLTVSDWNVQKYLYDGYQVAATPKDAAAVLAHDEAIMQATGVEQAVTAPVAQAVQQEVTA